jgi:hypothetical protein
MAVLAAGLACLAMSAATALSASLEYCNLYARAYASLAAFQAYRLSQPAFDAERLKRVYDMSWSKCLNQDEEPELPALAEIDASGGSVSLGKVASAAAKAAPAPVPKVVPDPAPAEPAGAAPTAPASSKVADAAGPAGPRRGSGFKAWTPEWVAWCSSHYRSFDPKTGTVKPFVGARTLCQ